MNGQCRRLKVVKASFWGSLLGRPPASPDLSGFAEEGRACRLALCRRARKWVKQLESAPQFAYLQYVGYGFGTALTPLRRWRPLWDGPDPVLIPLAFDGFGFAHGLLLPYLCGAAAARSSGQLTAPRLRLRPRLRYSWMRDCFDQGLGRSLWFTCNADSESIARVIATFVAARRPHLWAGIGLAAGYAGCADRAELERLALLSGKHAAQLRQGCAFAVEARCRGGNPTADTELAAAVLLGEPIASAAWRCRALKPAWTGGRGDWAAAGSAYELWRARVRAHYETAQAHGAQNGRAADAAA